MLGVTPESIRHAVTKMFQVNMGLRPGESAGVFTDIPEVDHWRKWPREHLVPIMERALLATMVYEIAKEMFPYCSFSFHPFGCTGRSGSEPGGETGDFLKQLDVAVLLTSFSLTHTSARSAATASGTRIASMPRFVADMFAPDGPMNVDFGNLYEETSYLAGLLTEAGSAVVRNEAGTDITLSLKGRSGGADTGMFTTKGQWGNLPAGEAFISPVERTAVGRIVVHKDWYTKTLPENMVLHVKQGEVVMIEGGGPERTQLAQVLGLEGNGGVDPSRRLIGELGVGTNPNARRTDITVEAEKIRGTVHIAVGSNSQMGGMISTDYHQDFVIPEPDLLLDGKKVIDRGRLVR